MREATSSPVAAMPTKTLPIVINGQTLRATASQETTVLLDGRLAVPRVNTAQAHAILDGCGETNLVDCPIDDIVTFLYSVGQRWKSRDYIRRRTYISDLVRYLGYSEKAAELEANWIAMILSSQTSAFMLIENELGSAYALDRWLLRGESEIRAFPKGLCFHCLPGNVPLSSVTSILRAVLTKNRSVAKTASGDPFTALALAQSFQDVDPTSPVTRSLSVLNWKGGEESEHEQLLIRKADVMCVWGSESAMRWAEQYLSAQASAIFFGPKRSLAVIDTDGDSREAARRVAHDVCHYDQSACFSVQKVFLAGAGKEAFLTELRVALDLYSEILPRAESSLDADGIARLFVSEYRMAEAKVRSGIGLEWNIIEPNGRDLEGHPLGRTVLVYDLSEDETLENHLDGNVQTIAAYPRDMVHRIRDQASRAGVYRFVEAGMTNIFRPGGAHDGTFPLQLMVNFSSCELSSDHRIRSFSVKIDQTTFLEEDKFLEFVQ